VEALGNALGVPTALITLLASTPEDVKGGSTAELASALLNTLVAASGPPASNDDIGEKE
jgi:hypothetical protein